MSDMSPLVVPFFKIHEGEEVVEIRIAGDRNFQHLAPAHSFWQRIDGVPVTYAERWPEAYAAFKESRTQRTSGTPLADLPFLDEQHRARLRAAKVYSAEALAEVDGANLLTLGPGGRRWKEQAAAFLAAREDAVPAALRTEIEELRAQLEVLRKIADVQPAPEVDVQPAPEVDERDALIDQIRAEGGTLPRGRPSAETLRAILSDLRATA